MSYGPWAIPDDPRMYGPDFDGPWQDEIATQDERDREALESYDAREPEDAE